MRKSENLICVLLGATLSCTVAMGQSAGVGNTASTSGDQFLQKQNVVDDLGNINSDFALFGVPLPPAELEGDFYLNEDFKQSRFELASSTKVYDNLMIRYDLRSNLIEINYTDGIRGLDGNKVKYFELASGGLYSKYLNSNQIKAEGEALPKNMFVSVMVTGKYPLYSYSKLSIKKADYNVALNVGNRNDQIIKKPAYFTVVDGKAIELDKGKNSNIFELAPEKEAELKAYAKENKINLREAEDFVAIINKLNSI